MNKKHVGGSLKDFLKEEGMFVDTTASACKRIFVFRIKKAMENATPPLTVDHLAKKLKTSRAQVYRILDEKNTSISLHTMVKVADALNLEFRIGLRE